MDLSSGMDLRGKRVTVMGLGSFGGGVGAVRFLVSRGALVTVTDLLTKEELAESLAEIGDCDLEELHLGGHVDADFTDADLVVVNPAVPPASRFLEVARRSHVPLTTEIALFWQFNRSRTAGVTGSNGKSTTAAMLHSILVAAGMRSRLGGNIGRSLLPEVDTIGPEEWAVLELSSFQLADLDRLPASPNVAVVTNFAPNHLDWHGSLADYRRAKRSILRWQSPGDVAVLNQDDGEVSGWSSFGRTLWFGSQDRARDGIFQRGEQHLLRLDGREEELPLRRWLRLPGEHNVQNAMAAACAAVAMGAEIEAVRRGLESFCASGGLPHRLQLVAEAGGRIFYNDSLATTPEAAVFALQSFSQPIVLLAGGYDKQIDLSAMAATIASRAKAVALMGQTADLLACLLESQSGGQGPAYKECRTFAEAFDWAVAQSGPGDVVLLSPGCASYDWFRNYADRGRQFVALVEAWQQRPARRS
jgi:UDP-N-acetylmuramoylalanine--D-glutamate ligase